MVKNPISRYDKITHQYDDIIDLPYPLQGIAGKRTPMSIPDRAKIFAPFAALRGYEEAIEAKQKIVVPRIELSEEMKDYLDQQIMQIDLKLQQGEHPMVQVVYFQKDGKEDVGEYIQFTGMVAKLNKHSRVLQIVDKKIRLEDICGIEGESLEGNGSLE